MRRIYLEDLPTNKNGTVSWKQSVGCNVRFEYDDMFGSIKILEYNTKNFYLKIQYKDRIRDIFVGNFKKCAIKEVLGIIHSEYKFNVGEVIFEIFKIEEQIRVPHAKKHDKNSKSKTGMNKAYVIRCLECNSLFPIGEDTLINKDGGECPICGKYHKKVVVGINDMWTTNPQQASMLLNQDDGYKYMQSSNAYVNWKCPFCHSIIENKSINNVNKNGLSCPICSDNISMPEKIMREILTYLNIDFKMHTTFFWSDRKEYDFYLSDYKMIIETHGEQHYIESKLSTRTLEEEQANDLYKKQMALQNDIKHYIVIDCRYSDFDYIYNNILNSSLHKIFNFNELSKEDIILQSNSNDFLLVCQEWNRGNNDIESISNLIHMSEYTTMSYLKKGTKLGICNYDGKTKKYLNHRNKTS